MSIGKAIKLYRVQRDLTQCELAEIAGVSCSYMSLLERGLRDPALSTIEKLATALNVPVVLLFFLAARDEDLPGFSPELREKLSYAALHLGGTI